MPWSRPKNEDLSLKVSEDRPQGTPFVWAINKSWLTDNVWQWARASNFEERLNHLAKQRDGNAFRELFFRSDPVLVCAVSPFRLNQRLTVQQGIFLSPGNVEESFKANLEAVSGYGENVLRVPIEASTRADLLLQLQRAGLSRASLFPGLDGFAQSLRTKMLLLAHLQRMEETGARSEININIDTLDKW